GTNALPHALDDERFDHVRLLLDAGADPNEGPILVHAWVGNADLVRTLLERGADASIRADAEFDTPLGSAALGSHAYELPNRDYVAVAELLTDAGNQVEPRFVDVADGPLRDYGS